MVWTGAQNGRGYGQRRVKGRVVYVHRHAWEEVHGPIPAGMTIDHLCGVKLCTNVGHMEVVTRSENSRRAAPRRQECRNGHTYEVTGYYRSKSGARVCKPCLRAAQRKYDRARAAKRRGAGVLAGPPLR